MTNNVHKPVLNHCLYPFIALMILSLTISMFQLDLKLADYFYSLQGNSWAWKNIWITETFFHKGGRALSLILALGVMFLAIASYQHKALLKHQKALLYLFLATAGASLMVSLLKSLLGVSCPWEFSRYGGKLDYSPVLEQLILHNGEGCFPAGHATAGYAWISLYGLCYQSRLRWIGLTVPLVLGFTLGLVQQIRGAHFISHDLWALAVCWFFSLGLYLFMFRNTSKNFI
jgi:membrane-associated PAP2 superfamily phosphatase